MTLGLHGRFNECEGSLNRLHFDKKEAKPECKKCLAASLSVSPLNFGFQRVSPLVLVIHRDTGAVLDSFLGFISCSTLLLSKMLVFLNMHVPVQVIHERCTTSSVSPVKLGTIGWLWSSSMKRNLSLWWSWVGCGWPQDVIHLPNAQNFQILIVPWCSIRNPEATPTRTRSIMVIDKTKTTTSELEHPELRPNGFQIPQMLIVPGLKSQSLKTLKPRDHCRQKSPQQSLGFHLHAGGKSVRQSNYIFGCFGACWTQLSSMSCV